MLTARGLAPKKSFGQNFMVDANFAAAIARHAGPDENTLLIEVGPGTGCLTRALLDVHPAARILAIEIDRGLAAFLREEFADSIRQQRLTLLEGDVLSSKHEISPILLETALQISAKEHRQKKILCSNLPYNVATSVLANFAAEQYRRPESGVRISDFGMSLAIATIQLELAERILAKPGDAPYGALSAFMALRTEGKIVRRAGGEVFWPRPNVKSAVISLEFKPWSASPLRHDEVPAFQDFLQKLFSQRRKTLRAVLKPVTIPPELNIEPNARAEELKAETLLGLFRSIESIMAKRMRVG